jgi:hypothetical protein
MLGVLIACATPFAEDFCRGLIGWHNTISYADHQYMHWTGRWTSMVIESFLFSVFNLYRSVPFILASIFALLFLATMYLFRQTLRLSMLFLAAWLSISHGIDDTLLWATGAIEYELPLSVALFALAMISRSRWWTALLLIIIASTMHELMALVILGACLSMLWMRRNISKERMPLVLLTVATIILVVFVIMAPGNFERAAPTHRSAIFSRLLLLASLVANWTTAVTTIGLLLFVSGRAERNDQRKPLDIIGWPCVIAGLALVSAVVDSFDPVHRVWNLMIFVYLLFLVYAAVWLSAHIKASRGVQIIGLLLLSLGVLVSRNVKDMAISAIHAPAYRQAITDRIRTHYFNRIPWPRSYYPFDVTSDPNFWINGCEAKYLGLASISCSTCDPSPGSSPLHVPLAAPERSAPPCLSQGVTSTDPSLQPNTSR